MKLLTKELEKRFAQVGRHWVTPHIKWFHQTNFIGESVPINYYVVKVSGG